MNFQFASQGTSFSGAMAYYCHDKRQPGEARHPDSAERVAWSETRNMLTERRETATQIMIATAERAPVLKERAGIAATGRKATKVVAAFSLAWHPDEAKGLARDEMVRVADEALKVMGLEHCQSVIIAHRDTKHPHVHVVVNRVNPETGRMEKIDPNRVRALDRWAHEYEQERGQIYSPNRAEKYARMEERRQQHPEKEDRVRHVEDRRQRPEARGEGAQERSRAGQEVREALLGPQSPAQALRARSEALKAVHKDQWKDLGRDFARTKAGVYDRWRDPIKQVHVQLKADAKPLWGEHFADERQMARDRARLERSFAGRLGLSIAAAREQRDAGAGGGTRSFARLVVANFLSRDLREATFARVAERDRATFGRVVREVGDERMVGVKEARSAELGQVREAYRQDRAALVERQGIESKDVRDAWREIYRNKGRGWEPRVQGAGDRSRDGSARDGPVRDAQGRGSVRDDRGRDEQVRANPIVEQERATERPQDAKPSKFDWLDQRDAVPDRGRKFERTQDAREKGRDKDKDRDDRER